MGPEATMPNSVDIQLLEENRYAVFVDGIVRYVGSLDECRRELHPVLTGHRPQPEDLGASLGIRLCLTCFRKSK
jgi:hypothetical protein